MELSADNMFNKCNCESDCKCDFILIMVCINYLENITHPVEIANLGLVNKKILSIVEIHAEHNAHNMTVYGEPNYIVLFNKTYDFKFDLYDELIYSAEIKCINCKCNGSSIFMGHQDYYCFDNCGIKCNNVECHLFGRKLINYYKCCPGCKIIMHIVDNYLAIMP